MNSFISVCAGLKLNIILQGLLDMCVYCMPKTIKDKNEELKLISVFSTICLYYILYELFRVKNKLVVEPAAYLFCCLYTFDLYW